MHQITDKPKFDSFRVYIPIEDINVIDGRLNTPYVKYYHEIDQIDEELNTEKALIVGDSDATIKYQILQRLFNNENKQVLCILIKSKILGSNYLQGITKSNIKEVYNIIINQKVVDFAIEDFMVSKITDIDICIDYPTKQSNIPEIMKRLSKMVVYPNYKHHFETKSGESLVLNKREKASPNKPHFKVYDKFAELENHSAEFKDTHLGNEFNRLKNKYGGLIRLEYTIKNKKHLKRLGLDRNELMDVMNMSDRMLTRIVESGLTNYIRKNKKKTSMKKTPTEIVISNCLDLLITEGYGLETIEGICDDIEDRSQRSKWKKRLRKLAYESSSDEVIKENTEVEQFLKKIKAI